MNDRKLNAALLSGLIVIKLLTHFFLIHPDFDLQRDEYLHLDLGKHLAWGYTSVPPLTGIISYLIHLFGGSVFWIKFFPALFGALTILVVWKTVEALKGSLFARVFAGVAVTFSVLFRLNILYQPNSFDVLSWTLLYYTLIRYVDEKDTRWLFAAATTFAFGFLNKYNIAFQVTGLLPALLLGGYHALFLRRSFYLSALLAFILILPNIWWQYDNGFPVITHMAELRRTQLVNVDRIGFMREQLLFFFPSIFVLISGWLSCFFYRPFYRYRFIPISTILILLLFVYFQAKAYYAIGLYPILLTFGAIFLDRLSASTRYLKPVMLLIPVFLFVPMLFISMPIYSPAQTVAKKETYRKYGMLRWEDGKEHHLPQDFADMLGWKELAAKVDRVYGPLQNKEGVMVICDNYGEAGAINYYSKFKGMAAVSFNADYKHWFNLNREIHTLINVKAINNRDLANEREAQIFKFIQLKGIVEDSLAREYGTHIFLMSEPKMPLREILREELTKDH